MDLDTSKLPEASMKQWKGVPLASLMEHIVQTHHVFCRQEVVRLRLLFKEVIDMHGKNHPELKSMQDLFFRMSKRSLDALAQGGTNAVPLHCSGRRSLCPEGLNLLAALRNCRESNPNDGSRTRSSR